MALFLQPGPYDLGKFQDWDTQRERKKFKKINLFFPYFAIIYDYENTKNNKKVLASLFWDESILTNLKNMLYDLKCLVRTISWIEAQKHISLP